MSAAPVIEAVEAAAPDAVALRLEETLTGLRGLVPSAGTGESVTDADRIDRIAALERLQASVEAVKAVEMVALARSHTEQQVATRVHPGRSGVGSPASSRGRAGSHQPKDPAASTPPAISCSTCPTPWNS